MRYDFFRKSGSRSLLGWMATGYGASGRCTTVNSSDILLLGSCWA